MSLFIRQQIENLWRHKSSSAIESLLLSFIIQWSLFNFVCIFAYLSSHLLNSSVTYSFIVILISGLIFNFVIENCLKLPLGLRCTEWLCYDLLLFVVCFCFVIVSCRELFLETIYTLLHLICGWHGKQITLIFASLVHSDVIVAALRFLFGIRIEAGGLILECFALRLE